MSITPPNNYYKTVTPMTPSKLFSYTNNNNSSTISSSLSMNYDLNTGLPNNAIQFYNQASGIYNGIDITDSYGNLIIGNLNGTDLDFSAKNLFKFTSSQGISVNNNTNLGNPTYAGFNIQDSNGNAIYSDNINTITMTGDLNLGTNDITCNDISCNDISCNYLQVPQITNNGASIITEDRVYQNLNSFFKRSKSSFYLEYENNSN